MNNLREFGCANERHPWDVRGKVGSERKFASSDKRAKSRQISVSSRSWFLFGDSARGDPQILACSRGIWAQKNPIARPTDCYLDCERRRYFEKVASTLVFWRQMAPERESGRDFFTIISVFIVKIDKKRIFAAGAEPG